jgi:spore coat protein CotH
MRMIEDLTDEQIQSCLTEGIDLERFKRLALETQKLMNNYDNNGNNAYLMSEGGTAVLYCKEISNTFAGQEFSSEWETEFNIHYESVQAAGFALNELLKAE